ncbi:hypothetical protein ACFLU5_08045 [Bacteroidota bacterium]
MIKFSEITNDQQLWDFMTNPSEKLVESVGRLDGSIIILGGNGKMGKELIGLIRKADEINGKSRGIFVVDIFFNKEDLALFESLGVSTIQGDLTDEKFINSLPDVPLVTYMMGFKFGSSGDWRKAFHLNSIVPYLVGQKYHASRIVVFSSGNPYPHTSRKGAGSVETDELNPVGIYGWNIVARESSFKTTALQNPDQKICLYRLMYAQHLNYGVLIDLANMVNKKEPISVAMPAVNLVSQRDANEVAIMAYEKCNNDPWIINIAGPIFPVRYIVEKFGELLQIEPQIIDEEPEDALLACDDLCINTFGSYRDQAEEMIKAAAHWLKIGGKSWGKPTYFGKVKHDY